METIPEPSPVVKPDEKDIEQLNRKVLQCLKIDFANYKEQNFPVKTGNLKSNTTYELVGSEGVITGPHYLAELYNGKLLADLKQFMHDKYIEHFNEEKGRFEQ